jgi:hypothetical protein
MPGYIYLLMMADGVYKVGRTEQEYGTHLKRLKSYPADSVIVYVRKVQDEVQYEKEILCVMRNEFGKHTRGHEYFIGDENRMIEIINGIVNIKPVSMFDKHPLKKFIESGDIMLGPSKSCPLDVVIYKYKKWCRRNDIKSSIFNENFYNDMFSHYNIHIRTDTCIWNGFYFQNKEFVFGLEFNTYPPEYIPKD